MPEWIESIESRSVSSSGGRGQGRRVFHASGYTDPISVIAAFGKEISGVSVPIRGSVFSSTARGLINRDFSIEPVAGHTDLWRVEFTYEQISRTLAAAPIEPLGTYGPSGIGYVELTSEIRAEFVPAFRAEGVSIPVQGQPAEPDYGNPQDPVEDIGGRKIDAAGTPTSVVRRYQELVLTETVPFPDFSTYGTFRFARNSTSFLGAAAGRVLYRGASVRRTGEAVYQVAHSFVDDELYHLQQQPLVDQEGYPLLDGRWAKTVYWVQPFPVLADLNLISSNF